jgi:serine/threonine protein kinase
MVAICRPCSIGSALEDDEPLDASSPAVPMYRAYSDHVLTRWYRAPEVILGERSGLFKI